MNITIETAKKLYPESPEWFKKELAEQFGLKNLRDWRFKTFADICEAHGTTEDEFNKRFSNLPVDTFNYEKLKITVKEINQGWEPDWNELSQKKWWPWFVLSSGFGFGDSGCYYTNTVTYSGSRLCYESKEKSDYAAQQFIEIYKAFLT